MTGRVWLSALALSAGMCSVSLADVTGKVTFDGKAPKPKEINMKAVPGCAAQHNNPVYEETIVTGENNELKNVVVYIKDGSKLGGATPKDPVVLDQKGCVYTPHVVTVVVGQELKAQNSDNFLHNVHGLARENGEFNFPQQQVGQVNKIDGAKAVETYKVKCDVHPWMSAWVVVLDHPFSGITGDNGVYTIKDVKDGKYTLVAWHERLGTQEAQIEVKEGKATADFKFGPRKKAAADVAKDAREVLALTKPADVACEHCEKDVKVVAKDAKDAQPQAAAK